MNETKIDDITRLVNGALSDAVTALRYRATHAEQDVQRCKRNAAYGDDADNEWLRYAESHRVNAENLLAAANRIEQDIPRHSQALNEIADLGTCAHGRTPAYKLFQKALDIATGAL